MEVLIFLFFWGIVLVRLFSNVNKRKKMQESYQEQMRQPQPYIPQPPTNPVHTYQQAPSQPYMPQQPKNPTVQPYRATQPNPTAQPYQATQSNSTAQPYQTAQVKQENAAAQSVKQSAVNTYKSKKAMATSTKPVDTEESTTEYLARKAAEDQVEHRKEKMREIVRMKQESGGKSFAARYLEGDPVPSMMYVCKCGYCGAENLLPIETQEEYKCYFCREDL